MGIKVKSNVIGVCDETDSGINREKMLEGRVWRCSGKSSIHKSNWERKIQPEDGLYSAFGRFVCDCEARNGISELNRKAVLQSVQRSSFQRRKLEFEAE